MNTIYISSLRDFIFVIVIFLQISYPAGVFLETKFYMNFLNYKNDEKTNIN